MYTKFQIKSTSLIKYWIRLWNIDSCWHKLNKLALSVRHLVLVMSLSIQPYLLNFFFIWLYWSISSTKGKPPYIFYQHIYIQIYIALKILVRREISIPFYSDVLFVSLSIKRRFCEVKSNVHKNRRIEEPFSSSWKHIYLGTPTFFTSLRPAGLNFILP